MRTYYRVKDASGNYTWTVFQTTSSGDNSLVYVATLCQVLLLSINESPFYSSYGIPGQQSVMQQVFPDYYVSLTQQRFAPYFVSLIITRQQSTTPTYNVYIVTPTGVNLSALVSNNGYLVTSNGQEIVLSTGQGIAV